MVSGVREEFDFPAVHREAWAVGMLALKGNDGCQGYACTVDKDREVARVGNTW